MSKLFVACLFFSLVVQATAERYSTEDESRFRSEPYTKADPGMVAPAAYIAHATAALRKRYHDVRLGGYAAPVVTRRFYHDAPAADRDIICVKFPYKGLVKPPLPAANRLPNPQWMVRPALLVLMRKDRSKAYVNEVYYQIW